LKSIIRKDKHRAGLDEFIMTDFRHNPGMVLILVGGFCSLQVETVVIDKQSCALSNIKTHLSVQSDLKNIIQFKR